MKVHQKEITFQTNDRRELINITEKVEKIVMESGVSEGIVLVFVPHATAGLIINEDEPRIRKDYLNLFERLVPRNERYEHNIIDNNADAHLLSMLLKPYLILPVKNGRIVRGTWQEIFFVELDGPRALRRVVVLVLGK